MIIRSLPSLRSLCCSLLVLILHLCGLSSQETGGIGSVPLDPAVRYGKLDNGFTYYIRYNNMPEKRAEFYLLNKAGAILEDDNQDGLAHFVEHMCFQGTENFPGKSLLEYFQSIGMEMGRGINAGTGTDQTTYLLMQTPVSREGTIDTALLALRDMACGVLFEGDEIDAERGVIIEEWRTRRNSEARLDEKLNPVALKGSKYAQRDIIGDLEVLKNFEHSALIKFYHDWYRPDLQAVVVVGDINVDSVEEKIRTLFSKMVMPENPRERLIYDLPDNDEPLIGIATDKEASNINVSVYYKHKRVPPSEIDSLYYAGSFKRSLYFNMVNQRLRELTRIEEPPYIDAISYYGGLAGNRDTYMLSARAIESKIITGLNTLLTENERLRRYGFTQGELDRARAVVLNRYESDYKEKEQQSSRRLAIVLSNNFNFNYPTPSAEYALDFARRVMASTTLEELNQLAAGWITDRNVIVTITGPEKDDVKMPEEEEIRSLLEGIKNKKIEPYIDVVSNRELMETIPAPGQVIRKNEGPLPATEFWEMSNGAKVILCPTRYKDDEILIYAFSEGGKSFYKVEDLASATFAPAIARASGINGISQTNLDKLLTGKRVSINPFIDNYYEGINGSCSPDDFGTALQLIYLCFTSPSFDESSSKTLISRYSNMVKTRSLNPDAVFADMVNSIRFDRNPRRAPISEKVISEINFERARDIFKERFAGAGDFTFIFTGNIDTVKAKELIAIYIGGLPSGNTTEKWRDDNVRFPGSEIKSTIVKDLQVPKARSYINYHGDFRNTMENRLLLEGIRLILADRYTKIIREEEGGTYGVAVSAATEYIPRETFELSMSFDCDPARAEKFRSIIHSEIKELISNGPGEDEVRMVKEVILKKYENNQKENSYWQSTIEQSLKTGEPILNPEEYSRMVDSVTAENIAAAARELLATDNIIEIVLRPPGDK